MGLPMLQSFADACGFKSHVQMPGISAVVNKQEIFASARESVLQRPVQLQAVVKKMLTLP